ncbi:MAG: hypothetical protein IPK26_02465 [Planctomycetes bacterium]|nr:hypothetical protein [Planctomycetota bacterium]
MPPQRRSSQPITRCIALHSSPIAPETTPAKTDIGTWSSGNDTFVLAF